MASLTTDPEGYSIVICSCAGGPHIGTRKTGTVDACQRCGFITPAQYRAIVKTAVAEADKVIDRIADKIAGL